MDFKKKTIIWEDNNEPPKNYIWVKSDGNAYEFNHTTRQWEKIMSSNGSNNNSSNNSIDEIISFMEELETEGMQQTEPESIISIENFNETMESMPITPYKTYGNKDTAYAVMTYVDPNTVPEEPTPDTNLENIKLAFVFLSEEDYNKGICWKFDGCWGNSEFKPIEPYSDNCDFLVASEYPKFLYRNLIEEVESGSTNFQYALASGTSSISIHHVLRDSFNVFSCEINKEGHTVTLRLIKFEYDGEVWYAPLKPTSGELS